MAKPPDRQVVYVAPRSWFGRLVVVVAVVALVVLAVFFFAVFLTAFTVLAAILIARILWIQDKSVKGSRKASLMWNTRQKSPKLNHNSRRQQQGQSVLPEGNHQKNQRQA